jgi:hypothetical protein
MVTARRGQFIERAVRYFLAQSYLNRELIIIDNGEAPIADKIPPSPSGPGGRMIRYYHARRPEQTIGTLRNIACDVTNGDLIAHWDDDDWYHPDRLAHQVTSLGEAKIGGFHSCLWWDEMNDPPCIWRYRNDAGYALGATLMYKRSLWRAKPFLDTSTGEDNGMLDGEEAVTTDGLIETGGGRCYFIARMHETNSQRQNHEAIRRRWDQAPEMMGQNGNGWAKLDGPEHSATIERVKGLLA